MFKTLALGKVPGLKPELWETVSSLKLELWEGSRFKAWA